MCWTPICFARASRLPTNSASSMLFSCILAVANYASAELTRAQLRAYSMLGNASDLEVSFKKQFRHEGFFASLMLIGEALPVPGTIDMKRGGRESCGADSPTTRNNNNTEITPTNATMTRVGIPNQNRNNIRFRPLRRLLQLPQVRVLRQRLALTWDR